ncbi:50S ribosomal protein L11 methyltransferase [Desulfococcus sp.]|uniref:50S ribosomal protein L11 methyltransferase n=1 Tax=Desulfococcus sp. TaxID=2025834 RepID=UPI003593A2D2
MKTPSNNPSDIQSDIGAAALRILEDRVDGVTPRVLAGLLAAAFGRSRRWARSAVGRLVAAGELAYREQHGHTIIEPSFDRPVRLSPHVVVKPAGTAYTPRAGDVVVRLAHGASFGTGQHPTTRLSVRGIDMALTELGLIEGMPDAAALDVGTGSGILAIAALMLGIRRGVGVDIDPCAVDEAKRNAALNGLSERLSIGAVPIGEIRGTFALITANLRFPTLRRILTEMLRLSAPRAAWVVSGIRSGEVRPLREEYAACGLECRWQAEEKDWAALAFERE